MKVALVPENQDQVLQQLRRQGGAGVRAGKKVVPAVTRRVAAKARPLTPVDPEDGGALRDTVRSTGARVTRSDQVDAAVMAGGRKLVARVGPKRARIYPTVQHEDVTLRHSHGQAKFIEIPFLQESGRAEGELVDELDRELGR